MNSSEDFDSRFYDSYHGILSNLIQLAEMKVEASRRCLESNIFRFPDYHLEFFCSKIEPFTAFHY